MSVFAKVCTGLLISTLSLTGYAGGSQPEVKGPEQSPAGQQEQGQQEQAQQEQQAQEQAQKMDVSNTAEVIQSLHVCNVAESRIAELIKQKASDERVRRLAEEIARDHIWMDKSIELLARIKGVGLKGEELTQNVQSVESQMSQEYQTLAQKPQTEFRRAALRALVREHRRALAFFNRIEKESSDDAVKAIVVMFRQTIEKHLAEAQKLEAGQSQPSPSTPGAPSQPTQPSAPSAGA